MARLVLKGLQYKGGCQNKFLATGLLTLCKKIVVMWCLDEPTSNGVEVNESRKTGSVIE